jgi:hypothetical protein
MKGTILPVFMLQLSKNYTRHGTVAVHIGSMLHFLMGCGLVLQKLRSTITRPRHHMPIHLLCVGFFFVLLQTSHRTSVLNPNEKMSYFEKNWDPELQVEVLRSAENIVSHRLGLVAFSAHPT